MKPNDPADHLLHIDEQMRFDLACNCIAACRDWEEMREAIDRVNTFWPENSNGLYAEREGCGVGLR